MDLENKLQQFSQIVYEEALKYNKEVNHESLENYRTACNEFREATQQHYVSRLKNEQMEMERNSAQSLMKKRTEARRQLIEHKNQAAENLFDAVIQKVFSYVQTEAYLKSLLEGIKKQRNTDYNQTVYLVKRDMKYKDVIEKETGVSVRQSQYDFIGGFTITNGQTQIIDCSFKTKIEDEKDAFSQVKIGQV